MLYGVRVSWHIGKYLVDKEIANTIVESGSFYSHCSLGKFGTEPKHTAAIIVNELINNNSIRKEDLTPLGLSRISEVVTASDLFKD